MAKPNTRQSKEIARIKIFGKAVFAFGGKEGHYLRPIISIPEMKHHYTATIDTTPELGTTQFPFEMHKTSEESGEHDPLVMGSIDPLKYLRSRVKSINPSICQVDSSEWRDKTVLTASNDVLSRFFSKNINIQTDTLKQIQIVGADEFMKSSNLIAFPQDKEKIACFVRSGSKLYEVKLCELYPDS